MDKPKVEPVVLPDVHDPTTPITDLIPPLTDRDQPRPGAGTGQPQSQPQNEPLEPGKDTDIGGG